VYQIQPCSFYCSVNKLRLRRNKGDNLATSERYTIDNKSYNLHTHCLNDLLNNQMSLCKLSDFSNILRIYFLLSLIFVNSFAFKVIRTLSLYGTEYKSRFSEATSGTYISKKFHIPTLNPASQKSRDWFAASNP
jgi:hypothetical protein